MTAISFAELSDERRVGCPYCAEPFFAVIDASAGSQQYVEDCPVCCAPILFDTRVDQDGKQAALTLRRENE